MFIFHETPNKTITYAMRISKETFAASQVGKTSEILETLLIIYWYSPSSTTQQFGT